MTVHSLIEVSGGKTYKAGCGEVVSLKKAGPMPKEFTGWSSKVTCDRCRWRPAVWPIMTLMREAGWVRG